MGHEPTPEHSGISRRSLFAGAAGVGLGGAVLLGGATAAPAMAAAPLWRRPDRAGAPRVAGLHLQFGADASREVVVSWHSTASVSGPRVLLGTPGGGLGHAQAADTTTYRDAKSGTEVQVHHARLTNLRPGTDYIYAATHDGAHAELGTVRTAPRGRAPFTFTSFGDQATPTLGKLVGTSYVNDNLGSPAAGDLTAAVERVDPLFHLVNGDLCYANLATDRIRTWSDWFENNSRSARYRPWMPAAGNHENELGNGPIGYGAYQTYFTVPDSGAEPTFRGLWYAFTAGSVRIISLNNDDVCYQDGGNSYVRGYSGGAQRRWLEAELTTSRADPDIDWIVVCMHQVVVSTVDKFNGADRGIRESWVPLFDRYGVDLVVCGHEHHYERSHPVRGAQPTDTLTPIPVATHTDIVDTSKGTVHMVIGGGGTTAPSNTLFFTPARCRVITGVGAPDPTTSKRPPVYGHRGRPVVGGARPRPSLRLRRLHRGPGPARWHHLDRRHLLRGQRPLRGPHPGRPVHPHPAAPRPVKPRHRAMVSRRSGRVPGRSHRCAGRRAALMGAGEHCSWSSRRVGLPACWAWRSWSWSSARSSGGRSSYGPTRTSAVLPGRRPGAGAGALCRLTRLSAAVTSHPGHRPARNCVSSFEEFFTNKYCICGVKCLDFPHMRKLLWSGAILVVGRWLHIAVRHEWCAHARLVRRPGGLVAVTTVAARRSLPIGPDDGVVVLNGQLAGRVR